MSKLGHFWIKIGDYETPTPVITNLKDEFMARQAFNCFLKGAPQIMDLEKEDAEVLVVHSYNSLVPGMDEVEEYFKGTFKEAIEWAKNSKKTM